MFCLKKCHAFMLALFIICALSSASYAWDASSEVSRLNKEAPSLDSFKDAEAVVWLRNNDTRMRADGMLQNTRQTIVMMGEKIPESWKVIKIPVPAGGKLEVEDASWYNPMTGLIEGKLDISDEILAGGAAVKVVKTPDVAVGRAVVLALKTTYPDRFGADGTIAMADQLPIWEQNVTVEVPEGRELFWLGRDMKEPEVIKSKGTSQYKWNVMNQTAWHGKGFVVYSKPALTFSMRKGISSLLAEMDKMTAQYESVQLPSDFSGRKGAKTGRALMEWIATPQRTLSGYPSMWFRPVDQLPSKGPWTPWEQTLLLHSWLKKLGWHSTLWWDMQSDIDDDAPVSAMIWETPVIQASPANGKGVYYVAGQASDFGSIVPALAGTTVWRLENEKTEKKKISSGAAGANRLFLNWVMDLSENGAASGKLTVDVTGGWTDLFSSGMAPSVQSMKGFLNEKISFAIPGMVLTPMSVKTLPTGYKLEYSVTCSPAIMYQGSLLLRLPGGIPTSVGEMVGRETEYTLRFPFLISQKVRMNMPHGYRLVQEPTVKNIGQGTKAVLKESIYHWPKKADLIAESAWTVKSVNIDKALSSIMKEELSASLRWPTMNLPFKK